MQMDVGEGHEMIADMASLLFHALRRNVQLSLQGAADIVIRGSVDVFL